MHNLKVIDFTQYRDDDDKRPTRKRSKKRLKGSVYGRNGKLWVDFRYLVSIHKLLFSAACREVKPGAESVHGTEKNKVSSDMVKCL